MTYFKLKWSSFDSEMSYIFFHPNRTPEVFNSEVRGLLRQFGDEYIQESDVISIDDWMTHIVPKLVEMGYELIHPATFELHGGMYIQSLTDYGVPEFMEIVGRELIEKAIQKNLE